MKDTVIQALAIALVGHSLAAANTPVPRPIEVEVAYAEAIVVGRLVTISTPAAFSFSFHNLGANNYRYIFNILEGRSCRYRKEA